VQSAARNYEIAARKLPGDLRARPCSGLGFCGSTRRTHRAAGDFEELRKADAGQPLALEAGVYLGRIYLEKKEFKKAELFWPLLQDAKMGVEAACGRRAGCEARDSRRSGQVLTRPISRHSDDAAWPNCFTNMAARWPAGAVRGAGGTFSRIAAQFPAAPQRARPCACRRFARIGRRNSRRAWSKAAPSWAISPRRGRPELMFLEAENLFFLDRTEEALAAYRKFLQAAPTHASAEAAHWRTGQALYQQQKWEDARRELEPLARKQDAGALLTQAGFLAGDCCYQTEQWAPALEHLPVHPGASSGSQCRPGLVESRLD